VSVSRIVLCAGLLLLGGCSREAEPAPEGAFGAASWLPEDSACLLSLHAPASLWRDIAGSRAFADLSRLPFVRAAIAETGRSMAMLQVLRRQQPLLDDWLAVLEDASGHEVFVTAGRELVPFTAALLGCVQQVMFAQLAADLAGGRNRRARDQETARAVLTALLSHGDALHLPPVTLGLRLSDARRGASLIDRLVAAARSLPGKVASVRQGGADYRVWELTADAFPGWRQQLQRGLAQGGLPAAQIEALADFVAGLKLSVAAGLRGDCLLLSVGHGTQHLARLGSGRALAAAPAFAGLLDRNGRLLSLTWVSGALRDLGRLPVEPILALVGRALPAAPLGESRGGHFEDDLRRFLTELDARTGAAPPYLSATFVHRGLETLRFGVGTPSGDASAPLATWSKAGPAPLLALASRSAPAAADYDWLARWTSVFYGHFQALAVPRMSARERDEFTAFAAMFEPAFAEFDATTREFLLPAVDGTEALVVADGWLEFDRWPGAAQPLPAPVRLPRLACVWPMRDAGLWLRACRRYGAMLEELFAQLAGERQLPFALELPVPQLRRVEAGTLYSWLVPGLAAAIEPCVLVAGNTVVFAATPAHAQELLARTGGPAAGVVDLRGPAASAGTFDIAQACAWLQQDGQQVLHSLAAAGAMPDAEAQGIAMQIEVVLRALSAVKRLQVRRHRQEGLDVEHSWLEVEDGR
jgi:hypothetical protein